MIDKLFCFLFGHKWYISLYTKFEYKHCANCLICKKINYENITTTDKDIL